VPVSPVPESEFVADVIAARRERGLPADERAIRRAIENSCRPDYGLPGLFLTPEEQSELETVDRTLVDHAEALVIDAGGVIGRVAWCWLDGRRAASIAVKHDVDRYRQLLIGQLGAERVVVAQARFSRQELDEMQERLMRDWPELKSLGIDVAASSTSQAGLGVNFFAADRPNAEQILTERYGPDVVLG
jgi:hypothetical protein